MEDIESGINKERSGIIIQEQPQLISTNDDSEDPIPIISTKDNCYEPKKPILSPQKKSSIPTIFEKGRKLQQLWQKQLGSIYAHPMLGTMMRIMMIFVIMMKSFAQVPLSFMGVNLKVAKEEEEEEEDDDEMPSIQKGSVQTTLGEIHYFLCDGTTSFARGPSTSTSNTSDLPILCIHAFRQSSDEFREILPMLAAGKKQDGGKHDGRKVLAIDLLSHGKSDPLPAEVSRVNRKKLTSKIADACGLEVALSISGMDRFVIMASGSASTILAQDLATRYPQRVRGVISVLPTRMQSISSGPETSSSSMPPSEPLLFPSNRNVLRTLFDQYEMTKTDLEEDLKLRMFHSELTYWIHERERTKAKEDTNEHEGQQMVRKEDTVGGRDQPLGQPNSTLESVILAAASAANHHSQYESSSQMEGTSVMVRCPSLCITNGEPMKPTDMPLLFQRMAKINLVRPPCTKRGLDGPSAGTTITFDLRQETFGKEVVGLCLDFLNQNSI